MISKTLVALAFVAESLAFPWVARLENIDSSLLRRQQPPEGAGSAANCPYNPIHKGAAPIKAPYLYNNAKNGLPGNGKGGYQVPAPGDKAHAFVAPNYKKDIRGPCPALNTAANHNFLSHDGITTFNELVDMQQNVYNVGYDVAVVLAVVGVTIGDGDVATERVSIGCDATTRTSVNPTLTGAEPGLDGHNKFEGDTSLTRNDFFPYDGDNFSMNGTLFGMMTETTGGIYDRKGLSLYRYQRYHQSIQQNPNFFFGPCALLLYGAASFVYELFASGTHNYVPDEYTISSFFGAQKLKNGSYTFNGKEQIPANWTNRLTPYNQPELVQEIVAQYTMHPVLFGGNTGNGTFDLITTSDGMITAGQLNTTNPMNVMCLIYQMSTSRIPSSLNGFLTPTVEGIAFAISKLGAAYKNLGCPLPLT